MVMILVCFIMYHTQDLLCSLYMYANYPVFAHKYLKLDLQIMLFGNEAII